MRASLLLWLLSCVLLSVQQPQPASSWPVEYDDQPSRPYSPAWQNYFRVGSLLNVDWTVGRGFAGNVDVMREGHPNNTLYFWAWEKHEGSLTAPADPSNHEPWMIWLNGGPGSSSMLGLFVENGPLIVTNGTTPTPNPWSWDKLADTVWVDQPVGTGYATADSAGYARDEDQVATDFINFLTNLALIFPSLAMRPLHLAGESYAGVYISYITKHLLAMDNPPVQLKKIAIGNGSLGNLYLDVMATAINVIHTHPQLINFNTQVYQYYEEQTRLCGMEFNLTYPQRGGLFPTVTAFRTVIDPKSPDYDAPASNGDARKSAQVHSAPTFSLDDLPGQDPWSNRWLTDRHPHQRLPPINPGDRDSRRGGRIPSAQEMLVGRGNATTIDPWYGCYLLNSMWATALNFSAPWSNNVNRTYNIYNVPDALEPHVPLDPGVYLNDPLVREAIHAPSSTWSGFPQYGRYPFGSSYISVPGANPYGDPSPEPMQFLAELLETARRRGVGVLLYSGNDDSIISHYGTRVVIQNTTWAGTQGFTSVPSTIWRDDDGNFAGIIHQERGLAYAQVYGAGHQVPLYKPKSAWTLAREFILGNNPLGSPEHKGTEQVDEIVNGPFKEVLRGENKIYTGAASTQGIYRAPQQTVAAWNQFVHSKEKAVSREPGPGPTPSPTPRRSRP